MLCHEGASRPAVRGGCRRDAPRVGPTRQCTTTGKSRRTAKALRSDPVPKAGPGQADIGQWQAIRDEIQLAAADRAERVGVNLSRRDRLRRSRGKKRSTHQPAGGRSDRTSGEDADVSVLAEHRRAEHDADRHEPIQKAREVSRGHDVPKQREAAQDLQLSGHWRRRKGVGRPNAIFQLVLFDFRLLDEGTTQMACEF